MSLLDVIANSSGFLSDHIALKYSASDRVEIFRVSEVYSLFYSLASKEVSGCTISDLPVITDFIQDSKTEGIYRHGDDYLVAFKKIVIGELQYVIPRCAGTITLNKELAPELFGNLVVLLKKTDVDDVYSPDGFCYLIKDHLYQSNDLKNILPFQVLSTVIPPCLEFQWVYLAMRNLSQNFHSDIPYLYLATEKPEIETLKKMNLYD